VAARLPIAAIRSPLLEINNLDRGPPLWAAAAVTEQARNDPQWNSSAQPEPKIEFDQRIA